MSTWPVPPHCLDLAVAHLEAGGSLVVATCTRATLIKLKHWKQWQEIGRPLLREEGDGFRMAQGKGSVYLTPGTLRFVKEAR